MWGWLVELQVDGMRWKRFYYMVEKNIQGSCNAKPFFLLTNKLIEATANILMPALSV
jgi:hypothetical protein